jgi:vacuolar-type H+-ATPase subunit I/STV1
MDTALTTTIVSTSGAVITGVFGMFFTANQLGKRIDDVNTQLGKRLDDTANQLGKRIDDLGNQLGKRIDDLRVDVKELHSEFSTFKEVVNGKLSAVDTEIAKLMDRRNPQ